MKKLTKDEIDAALEHCPSVLDATKQSTCLECPGSINRPSQDAFKHVPYCLCSIEGEMPDTKEKIELFKSLLYDRHGVDLFAEVLKELKEAEDEDN